MSELAMQALPGDLLSQFGRFLIEHEYHKLEISGRVVSCVDCRYSTTNPTRPGTTGVVMSEQSAPQLCMVHVRKVSHPAETQYRGEVHYTFGPCGRPLPCLDHPAASTPEIDAQKAPRNGNRKTNRERIRY